MSRMSVVDTFREPEPIRGTQTHREETMDNRAMNSNASLRMKSAVLTALALMVGIALTPVVHFAAAPNGLPMTKPESVGMSSERLQRVTRRIQEYIDQGQVAGAVSLIARQGKVVHYEAQ